MSQGSAGLRHAALVKGIERWIARTRAERTMRRGIERKAERSLPHLERLAFIAAVGTVMAITMGLL